MFANQYEDDLLSSCDVDGDMSFSRTTGAALTAGAWPTIVVSSRTATRKRADRMLTEKAGLLALEMRKGQKFQLTVGEEMVNGCFEGMDIVCVEECLR